MLASQGGMLSTLERAIAITVAVLRAEGVKGKDFYYSLGKDFCYIPGKWKYTRLGKQKYPFSVRWK
jgi:hypothetical protein